MTPLTDKTTIDLVDSWKDALAQDEGKAKNTIIRYLGAVIPLLQYAEEMGIKLNQLDREVIVTFFEHQNYKNSTIRNCSVAVRSFFTWLKKTGRIEANPVKIWRVARANQSIQYFPEPNEIASLIHWWFEKDTAYGYRNAAMVVLMASAGLRRSEVVALNWADVQQKSDHYMIVVPPIKSKNPRLVPVGVYYPEKKKGDLAHEILSRWFVFNKSVYGLGGRDPFFPSIGHIVNSKAATREELMKNGRVLHLTEKRVYDIVGDAVNATGVSEFISPHTLRRFWASWCLRNGMNIEQLRQAGGWASFEAMRPYIRWANALEGTEFSKRSPVTSMGVRVRESQWSLLASQTLAIS